MFLFSNYVKIFYSNRVFILILHGMKVINIHLETEDFWLVEWAFLSCFCSRFFKHELFITCCFINPLKIGVPYGYTLQLSAQLLVRTSSILQQIVHKRYADVKCFRFDTKYIAVFFDYRDYSILLFAVYNNNILWLWLITAGFRLQIHKLKSCS